MSNLNKFIEATFKEEGAFQNNKYDYGNYYKGILYGTIYGITARNHFETFLDIYNTYLKDRQEALVKAAKFYSESEYWNPLYDEIKDINLAWKIFDMGINMGVRRSVKVLQRSINELGFHIKIDGRFGGITLNAVNKINVYQKYIENLKKEYQSFKNFFIFGKGWIKRLKRVFKELKIKYESF